MSGSAHHHVNEKVLAGKVVKNTEVNPQKCYQCGKCSAGCPLAAEMDYPPSVILRLLQTQQPANDEKVLRSYSIWVCLTCEMCYSRCPMEIDIPVMMDFLRQESMRQKMVNPKAKNIVKFHKAFLDSIKYTGRLSELGLIVDYKMRSWNLFQDVLLAPKMISRGKLHFIPEFIKNKALMKRIFQKTIERRPQ